MALFGLGKRERPLLPCSDRRAHAPLGRAALRGYPLTIRWKDCAGGEARPTGGHFRRYPLALAVAALLAGSAAPALAGLGGDASSIATDSAMLKGEVNVSTGNGFTVHEIQLPTGTVLREYLSPAGKVFAITWNGPVVPDLKQTLGTYYEQFRTAVRSAPRGSGHHHLAVDQPDLVIRAHGHMRSLHGLVYVPSLLPANVSLSDIR